MMEAEGQRVEEVDVDDAVLYSAEVVRATSTCVTLTIQHNDL